MNRRPDTDAAPARRHWLNVAAGALAAGCLLGRRGKAMAASEPARSAPTLANGASAADQPSGPARAGRGAGPAWLERPGETLTVHTLGDSVLDCGRYNDQGVQPGQLLVRNDDRLFPAFHGRDLQSHRPARLDHRAVDGATVTGLAAQLAGVRYAEPGLVLLSIGGNDLLQGLAGDTGPGVREFARALQGIVAAIPLRPLLMATVYDPTFGDDRQNFLGIEARIARANHRRVNQAIGEQAAAAGGVLVDLHGHFLQQGDPSWFTRTIEPSLRGASEVRRAFADALGLTAKT